MANAKRTLEFVYFDAGGGHRNAALSLESVISSSYPEWEVRLIHLQELLRPVDPFHRIINVDAQSVYNNFLQRGITVGGRAILTTLQIGIRFYNDGIEELLRQHWRVSKPDLVVSLIPNFNGPLFRALKEVHSEVPFVTVMTDIADYPPAFWMEGQNQLIICGSVKAAQQACERGYLPHQIFETSGMIIKPSFYTKAAFDREKEKRALGLDPSLPTALVMFGGQGSQQSLKIVKRLRRSKTPVQSLVMCGHNSQLKRQIEALLSTHGGPPVKAIGFTSQVQDYIALVDFFIGKPGPGSLSEALHMGLPVLIEKNRYVMPQERYNVTWIEENGFGLTLPSFKDIVAGVEAILEPSMLQKLKKNISALNNRAVFEVPALFEKIMKFHASNNEQVAIPFKTFEFGRKN